MKLDDKWKQNFHVKLDRDFEDKRLELQRALDQLEDERRRAHEWIDSAPDSVLQAFAAGINSNGLHVEHYAPVRIGLYEPIKSIVGSFEASTEITTPLIYDALLQSIPELEEEDEWKLKARIAATLGRMSENKILKVTKQGRGSAPHVYKQSVGQKMLDDILKGSGAKK